MFNSIRKLVKLIANTRVALVHSYFDKFFYHKIKYSFTISSNKKNFGVTKIKNFSIPLMSAMIFFSSCDSCIFFIKTLTTISIEFSSFFNFEHCTLVGACKTDQLEFWLTENRLTDFSIQKNFES